MMLALAVLLLPAGMGGRAAAMAPAHEMTATAGMDHCAQKPEPGKDQPPESCCVLACSALLSGPGALAPILPSVPAHAAAVPGDHDGLPAEAATPPPRRS